MRTIDVLKKWCHITDPEVLAAEVIRFESAILQAAEDMATKHGKAGIEVLPGVKKLVGDLGSQAAERNGEEKWAICTSCSSSSVVLNVQLTPSYLLLRRKGHPYCRPSYTKSLRDRRLGH